MSSLVFRDYLHSCMSFSTFMFDEPSFYAVKYLTSSFPLFKKANYNRLIQALRKHNDFNSYNETSVSYYIHATGKALENSSFLVSRSEQEMNLYDKLKKNNINYISEFSLKGFPYEAKNLKACYFTDKTPSEERLKVLRSVYPELRVITLNDVMKSTGEVVFDAIRMALIRDDSEIYFVSCGLYSNIVIDGVFQQNKIGIHF